MIGNVISKGKEYSSEELQNRIDFYKKSFTNNDIDGSSIYALFLPRDIKLLAIMIALYESSIPFLPIDRDQPKERVEYMLKSAQVKGVFVDEEISFLSSNIINVNDLSEGTTLNQVKSDIAYVLYTSGSTGVPKGVCVARKGLNNFLESIPKIIDFSTGVIGCFTTVGFDIFFLESLLALYQGLTVVFADEEEKDNPRRIIELIKKNGINIMQMTPSRLKMLRIVDNDLTCLRDMKIMMVGGEAFPNDLLEALNKYDIKIYNMYGPTETTIWSTIADLSKKPIVTIGNPIDNTTIYLLDDSLNEVSIGEICIGGDGLALGYINDEEKTKKAFIDTKYGRLYRTGDIGEYKNGELFCLGRKDNQVKINGFRVELDDIDANLSKISGIENSTTCFSNDTLVSYYQGTPLEEESIRLELKKLIPSYMIPESFVHVNDFTYTSSGKIDRNRMIETNTVNDDMTNRIIGVIKNVIGVDKEVTPKTNLANTGIDSIKYVTVIVELETEFDIEFDDEKLALDSFEDIIAIKKYIESMM